MTKPKFTVINVMGIITLLGFIGAGAMGLGFNMSTPAEGLQAHVEAQAEVDAAQDAVLHDHAETVEGHIAHADTFFVEYELNEARKDVTRIERTLQIEAQTKLICLEKSDETLILLGLPATCARLGVRR